MAIFQKATKKKSRVRVMVDGASGSGKTTAALTLATEVVKRTGGRIALIDSERGSASLYSDRFDFDVLEMDNSFSPEDYIQAITTAEDEGYQVVIIDTITPEWKGTGGCLNIHSKITGNSFTAWAKVTPRHDAFIQKLLQSKSHIIVTCRSKTQHELDTTTKKVTKQGLAPEQRDGLDYEMTVVFNMNQYHIASVSKDRTSLFDGKDFEVTSNTGNILMDWLEDGAQEDPVTIELREWFAKIGYGAAQQIAARKKYPDNVELLAKLKNKVTQDKTETEVKNEE